MKALLKTKCGCKKLISKDVITPAFGSTYQILLTHDITKMKPGELLKYRTFKFKEVNIHNVAIYEETD